MSNSKNYNSIFFLTTLSVYLGLVLVGATPSVLAQQAALTQKFEIKNEIEVEDDLDKNPDDDDAIELSGATGGYFNDLESLIEDLRKLHQIEKFNLNFDTFNFVKSQNVECGLDTIRRATVVSNIDNIDRWLKPAIIDSTYSFEGYGFLGDCLSNETFKNKKAVNYELKISYDKSSFKFELSLTKESKQKAEQLLNRFNEAYNIYKPDDEEIIVKKIYENTTFKSENNQVFIVTNLPRAAIDELLADNKDAQ